MDKIKKFYRIYIVVLAVAGSALALFITLPFGAGVSSDAMRNLAVAANFLGGKGLFDYIGSPFLWWPPLYPFTLAFISKLTRLDLFRVGWLLNVVVFGFNIWLAGLLFQRIFAGKIIYAYLNTFVVFISLALLKVSTNIASDPLFISFILLWFILWGDWDGKKKSTLAWLILLAALSAVQRLLGVILIGSGGLLILIRFRKELFKAVFTAGVFGVFSFLPLAGWLYGHNYLGYHTFFGPRSYQQMLPWQNFLNSNGKVLDWFFPYYSLQRLFPYWFGVVLILMLVLVFVHKKETWLAWLRAISGSHVAPFLLFSVVYYSILMFTIDSYDQRYAFSDRYQTVILFSLLTVFTLTFDKLVLVLIKTKTRQLTGVLLVFFAGWCLYPAYNLSKYVNNSRQNGESTYNLYNTRAYHQSAILGETQKILAREPDANIYSNVPGAVWFYTRHSLINLLPKYSWSKDDLKKKRAGWPKDKPGYIIWFEPDPYEIFFTPKDLMLIAELKVVSQTPDGTIYYVTQRGEP